MKLYNLNLELEISKDFEIAGSAITKNGIVNCYEVFKVRHSKKRVRKCVKSCRHTYTIPRTNISGQFLLIVLVV